jgi:SAM-dependent methyltransferase
MDAPAFHRNVEPLTEALRARLVERSGDVLEIGAGTGQHAVALARAFPELRWWPTDPAPRRRASVDGWARDAGLENLRPARALDAAASDWRLGDVDGPPASGLLLVLAVNVVHVAPWSVTEGLLAGAARHLAPDGFLALYGPFGRGGRHTAPSNAAFDASLRAQDPEWGVRDLEEVAAAAEARGLRLEEVAEMPANNLVVWFVPRG